MDLLNSIRQCAKAILIVNIEKSHLKKIQAMNRHRYQIIQLLLRIGDTVALDITNNLTVTDWFYIRETFVASILVN